MNPLYEGLHKQMLKDIRLNLGLRKREQDQAESCFWIASSYWTKLKDMIKGNGEFKTEAEEIDFFKNVKPRFTCYIEYFVILSEASPFVPLEKISAIDFWEEEAKRFGRFYEKHKHFLEYFKSGKTCHDPDWFLRKNKNEPIQQGTALFDQDPGYCTSHDGIVRRWLAFKKYYQYVRGKIEVLNAPK